MELEREPAGPGQEPRLRQTSVVDAECKLKQPRQCRLHEARILAGQSKSGQNPASKEQSTVVPRQGTQVVPWTYLGSTLVVPWSKMQGTTKVLPGYYQGTTRVLPRYYLGTGWVFRQRALWLP
jgi:hypothetical protein